jgi:alpha-methylacyl-CoA racemase
VLLVAGLLAALYERDTSGVGRVVDLSLLDSAVLMSATAHAMLAQNQWTPDREANLLDGGAPFYATYRTADGRFLAIGALEARFYAEALRVLGLSDDEVPDRGDRANWPAISARIAGAVASKTSKEWQALTEAVDCCISVVLDPIEAPVHVHNRAERNFVQLADGAYRPALPLKFGKPASAPRSSVDSGAVAVQADPSATGVTEPLGPAWPTSGLK